MQIPELVQRSLETFEPSGAVYLGDLDKFLLVLDDTDEKSRPLVFMMDRHGQVTAEAFELSGLRKLSDIESVSADEKGRVYVMASLSLNKNGKDKAERDLLVRARRTGSKFTVDETVNLRQLLISGVKASTAPELRAIHRTVEDDLDVESHFVRDGQFYVGLKNPQPQPGHALILNLGSVEELINKKQLPQLNVWKVVDFKSISGAEDFLSETMWNENELWLATTSAKSGPSRLWKFNEISGKPEMRRKFEDHRLEGMAADPVSKKIMMTFDQNDKEPFFLLDTP